jgi:signal transduction histidine kinase/CheY-like chemotaxis protein
MLYFAVMVLLKKIQRNYGSNGPWESDSIQEGQPFDYNAQDQIRSGVTIDPAEPRRQDTSVVMRRSRRQGHMASDAIVNRGRQTISRLMLLGLLTFVIYTTVALVADLLPAREYQLLALVALVAGLCGIIGACAALVRSRSISPSSAVLQQRNRLLAERLERLEDKSWEVRESEEIHRSMFEAFGDVVIHRNAEGEVVFQNSVFGTYFDVSFELPVFMQDQADPGERQRGMMSREIEFETLVGQRWFSWNDMLVRDPLTGEVGQRSVARDITHQKNSEQEILSTLNQANQANAAKSRFLAMVSHEIRTPLHGIIGMAGLLSDTPLAPDQKNYVEAISSSGRTLLNLIEDLLDTARIENGHVELAPRCTNITQLVEDVAELLAPAAREKGLDIASRLSPEVPPNITIDSGRLRQVLLNLVGNAIKFTQTGGVSIEVAMAAVPALEGDLHRLTFTVRDSGPGLAEADQKRIFNEFVQTDEGATRQHGGAGLGLAISQNLVGLMGGRIEVASQLGRGTSFEFSINAEVSEFTSPTSPAKPSAPDISKKVAVILSRNPARRVLVQSIRDLGAIVSTFDSIDAFDLNHPEADPFEAVIVSHTGSTRGDAAALKSKVGENKRIINIGDSTATRWRADEQGHALDGWLTWPVRRKTLQRVLANAPDLAIPNPTIPTAIKQNEAPLRILLAEDNSINALLAKSLLAKQGHIVTHVEDGMEAVNSMRTHRFDMVFMDLHMPVMDGLTALKEIRSMKGPSSIIPIVVLSADGQNAIKDKALSAGATDFLVKPMDPDALCDLLRRVSATGSPLAKPL